VSSRHHVNTSRTSKAGIQGKGNIHHQTEKDKWLKKEERSQTHLPDQVSFVKGKFKQWFISGKKRP